MAAEGSSSGVAGVAGGEAPAPSASNGDRSRSSPPAAGSSSAGDLARPPLSCPPASWGFGAASVGWGLRGFAPPPQGVLRAGQGPLRLCPVSALAQLDYSAFIHIGRQVLLYASSFFDVVSVGHTI